MSPWLQYLIAFVVGCHGSADIPFGIVVPGALEERREHSWLMGSVVAGGASARSPGAAREQVLARKGEP